MGSGDTNVALNNDRIGAASVQFMLSKDGSNSHEDFGQINLKISNKLEGIFVNTDHRFHTHSQPKILSKAMAGG